MVMTLLSHSMTFSILSAHKFGDAAGNLMLMTLPTETGLIEQFRLSMPAGILAIN
jgi:hypothetical protein